MSSKLSGSEPCRSLLSLMRGFASSRSGNVAVISALLMVPMMGVAGIAVDYAFAVKGQGKLNQVALIAATNAANAARNVLTVAGPGSSSLDSTALAEGKTVAERFFNDQAITVPNTSVASKTVTVKRTGNTITANVTYNATVSTFFAPMFGVSSLNINGGSSMIVSMMDKAPTASNAGLIIDESWTMPAGTSPQVSDASLPVINDWFSGTKGTTSPLTGPPIVRSGGGAASTASTIRVGNPNGSIAPIVSKKVYLEAGYYELRYWYKSTVNYTEYDPVFICGTVDAEMNWATSMYVKVGSTTTANFQNVQTARAGVYLNPIVDNPQTSSIPKLTDFKSPGVFNVAAQANTGPPHSYHSRVDICAYSSNWIQRSVPIEVTDAGYFWLNFVSEPALHIAGSTRNGFYLGPVQMCKGAMTNVQSASACPGALNNNWPWAPGTVLYDDTFDEAPAVATTPGLNTFNTSRSVFTAASRYDKVPDWVRFRFSGITMAANSFVYETAPAGIAGAGGWISGNLVRATRMGVVLYRRMLLMPGTYKFQFAASANENSPDQIWCPTSTGGSYALMDKTAPECSCAAGNVTTMITSDENRTPSYIDPVNGAGATVKSSPPHYRGPGDGLTAYSDCHSGNLSSRTIGEIYCVLVPRTQYYGFRLAIAGPYMDTTAGTPFARFTSDVMLNRGNPSFDHLQVTVLSMGVKNKFTGTASSPGDFDTYQTDCPDNRVGAVQTPSPRNILDGAVPMWPGYSTITLNRVKVMAPRF